MRASKSYKSYGPIPRNEYNVVNTEKDADSVAVLDCDTQTNSTGYGQRLLNRQALHPSGRRRIRGWTRSWKANGWRNELASRQDEFTGVRRYSNYVLKIKHNFE